MAKLPAPLANAFLNRAWPDVATALDRASTAKEPVTTAQNLAAMLAWSLTPPGLDAQLPLEKDSMTVHEFKTTRHLLDEKDASAIFQHALPTLLRLSAAEKLDPLLAVLDRWTENRRNAVGSKSTKEKEPTAEAVYLIAQALVTALPRKEANQALVSFLEPQIGTPLNKLLLERITRPEFLDLLAERRVALPPSALLFKQTMWLDSEMKGHTETQEDPMVAQTRVVERLMAHPARLQLVRTDLNPITNLSKGLKSNLESAKECAMVLAQALIPIYEGRGSAYTERLKALAQAPAFETAVSTGKLEPLQRFLANNPTFHPEGGWEKAMANVADRLVGGAQQVIVAPQLDQEDRLRRLNDFAEVLEFVLINWTEDAKVSNDLAASLNQDWKRRTGQSMFVQDVAERVRGMTADQRADATDRIKALDANPVIEVLRNVAGPKYRFSVTEVLGLLEAAPAPTPAKRPGPR